MATLNHNDSITVFYGGDALTQAYIAAVNGDIITLSPGQFTRDYIGKAITIRGAGMFSDTVLKTDKTIISGNVHIHIPNDSVNRLSIEGVKFLGTVYCSTMYNPQFKKCIIPNVAPWEQGGMRNASFINCLMSAYTNRTRGDGTWMSENSVFHQLCDCWDYVT